MRSATLERVLAGQRVRLSVRLSVRHMLVMQQTLMIVVRVKEFSPK